MDQVAVAALVLGCISSLHCVGMCGPLVLALPCPQHMPKIIAALLYHSGRIAMYTIMGLLFGLAGRGIYLTGFQQSFTISLGVALLFFLVLHRFRRRAPQPQWLQQPYFYLMRAMNVFLHSKNKAGIFLMGVANGLLPCGMVYLALAGALSAQRAGAGAAFMLLYGAGTLPAMLTLHLFAMRLHVDVRNYFRKLVPYAVAATAVLLILRGLNLGIPFISPVLPTHPQQAIECH